MHHCRTRAPPPAQSYVLLNCDDHATYLAKHKKDAALYRPDICHQALLMILDSPLNKAGKVKVRARAAHAVAAALLALAQPRVRRRVLVLGSLFGPAPACSSC